MEGRKEKCNIYTTSPKGWLVPSNIGGGGVGVVRIIRWLFMIIVWLFMIIDDVKMVRSKNRWCQRSLFWALESVSEVVDAREKKSSTLPFFHASQYSYSYLISDNQWSFCGVGGVVFTVIFVSSLQLQLRLRCSWVGVVTISCFLPSPCPLW